MARKWRLTYVGDASQERQLVVEFQRLFEANDKPKGMALISYSALDGPSALAVTPESNAYCESLFRQARWIEAENRYGFGFPAWVAGDESLKA